MVELEKQRMGFTKDLEIQRLQLFMQTQVELGKLKHSNSHNTGRHYSRSRSLCVYTYLYIPSHHNPVMSNMLEGSCYLNECIAIGTGVMLEHVGTIVLC